MISYDVQISSQLPVSLRNLLGDFYRIIRDDRRTPEDDAVMWEILKEMIKVHSDPAFLKILGRDRSFTRAHFFCTERLCERWLRGLTPKPRSSHDQETSAPFNAVPTPTQALRMLHAFNNNAHGSWARVLWLVAKEVAELRTELRQTVHATRESVDTGARELMGLWNLCMATVLQRQETGQGPGQVILLEQILAPSTLNWSFLPDPAVLAESLQREHRMRTTRRSFSEAVDMLVPTKRIKVVRKKDEEANLHGFTPAALVTLDMLQIMKAEHGGESVIKPFEPWMALMEAALNSAGEIGVPAALEQRMELAESEVAREYYRGLIARLGLSQSPASDYRFVHRAKTHDAADGGTIIPHQAAPTEAVEGMPSGMSSSPIDTQQAIARTKDASTTDRFVYLSIKRLGRAQEQSDPKAAEKVHMDVVNFTLRKPDTQVPLQMYEHLILALLSFRRPQLAIDTWNRMVKAGHQPTSKTFTILMRGSLQARDVNAMENFWLKMRQAGIQPDRYAWSTKIFGLLRHKRVNDGIKALGEIGQEWTEAARAAYARDVLNQKKRAPEVRPSDLLERYEGDVDGVPRPDVVLLNSAVTGLAGSDDSLIPKVVGWGRSFGIEPDLRTYNVLINISMRRGLTEEALNILRRMNERGIEANSTTWTVLLTAMFEGGFLDDLAPGEQQARIVGTLTSLESTNASGIDAKGYALTIDRLLKNYNNPSAAQAVVEHMTSRGVQLTPHIYTILMASYFQESPPNFAAAENLWSQIQSANAGYGAALDNQFYDRMVEGYATHHAFVGTAQMLSFLSRMEAEGKKPSWRALESAARALAEAREWESLAQIVDGVRRRLRKDGIGGTTTGQMNFWQFVISTGLLKHEGIRSPEQIMQIHQSEHEDVRLGHRETK